MGGFFTLKFIFFFQSVSRKAVTQVTEVSEVSTCDNKVKFYALSLSCVNSNMSNMNVKLKEWYLIVTHCPSDYIKD